MKLLKLLSRSTERRLRSQDNSLKNLNANVPKDENAGRSWLCEERGSGSGGRAVAGGGFRVTVAGGRKGKG